MDGYVFSVIQKISFIYYDCVVEDNKSKSYIVMTTTPMAGILTAKPDYSIMSFKELSRRSPNDAEAAAELAKRQQANAARKALWSSPEYIAEETRRSKASLVQEADREERIYQDIIALNADYKSAIAGWDESKAYTWFVWTGVACRDWDMLNGRIRLNKHEHVELRDAVAIHRYLKEVYPSFLERLLDEHPVAKVDKPVYSPPSLTRTRRSPVKRFKTW